MRKIFRPYAIDSCPVLNCFKTLLNYEPYLQRFQRYVCEQTGCSKVKHLICFKQWNSKMVLDVVCSARNLKNQLCDSHQRKWNILPNAKVMILQEINEPMLNMAVSKAASLLGADDVGIIDNVVWDHDYHGRLMKFKLYSKKRKVLNAKFTTYVDSGLTIFSDMADIIFVSTNTHMCVQRFADRSTVPVLCMMSRTHASLQSLATIMAIMEEFGTLALQGLRIAYVGPPHPVLNSYLLLFPMLGANIKFKCCCKVCPVTPLLMNASQAEAKKTSTESKQCVESCEALTGASVIIAGPTTEKKEKIPEFVLSVKDICSKTTKRWIFFHTCPRGMEVDDNLFWNENTRTFHAFQNMHYIAAALMAYCIRGHTF